MVFILKPNRFTKNRENTKLLTECTKTGERFEWIYKILKRIVSRLKRMKRKRKMIPPKVILNLNGSVSCE